ncbi:MgtC/SapB family protein [Bradyrhizobium sp.]|uniref:MgtC/SapB family protein n=1 Tax=Bradyrhizobium sp. TaxID=376 RepID=UPI003C78786A
MPILDSVIVNLAVALGIGLLIGAERERRKGKGPSRLPAGIRTFTAASLAGAVSFATGGELLLAVTTAGAIILTAVAYLRSHGDDPGLTSGIALILTVLLGGLSVRQPALAAGVAVVLAALLASRTQLHHFVRLMLTEREVADGLIFASATLVVLPLLPDQQLGPYGALNPRSIWIIVILVMAISAAGYIAVRTLGARFGLAVAGLASGFVSSIATISAMGTRAATTPAILAVAVAGAVLSTVATIVQLCAVLAATSMTVLRELSIPLFCSGLAAASYGAFFTIKALRGTERVDSQPGHAFSFSSAIILAASLSGILVVSAALRENFGEIGAIVGAALAGFADTHSAAVSIASLVASGKMSPADAISPILAALSTNTVSKIIAAWTSGGRSYALRLIPGLLLVISAAWAGTYAPRLFGL